MLSIEEKFHDSKELLEQGHKFTSTAESSYPKLSAAAGFSLNRATSISFEANEANKSELLPNISEINSGTNGNSIRTTCNSGSDLPLPMGQLKPLAVLLDEPNKKVKGEKKEEGMQKDPPSANMFNSKVKTTPLNQFSSAPLHSYRGSLLGYPPLPSLTPSLPLWACANPLPRTPLVSHPRNFDAPVEKIYKSDAEYNKMREKTWALLRACQESLGTGMSSGKYSLSKGSAAASFLSYGRGSREGNVENGVSHSANKFEGDSGLALAKLKASHSAHLDTIARSERLLNDLAQTRAVYAAMMNGSISPAKIKKGAYAKDERERTTTRSSRRITRSTTSVYSTGSLTNGSTRTPRGRRRDSTRTLPFDDKIHGWELNARDGRRRDRRSPGSPEPDARLQRRDRARADWRRRGPPSRARSADSIFNDAEDDGGVLSAPVRPRQGRLHARMRTARAGVHPERNDPAETSTRRGLSRLFSPSAIANDSLSASRRLMPSFQPPRSVGSGIPLDKELEGREWRGNQPDEYEKAEKMHARRALEVLKTIRALRRQTEDLTVHLLQACGEWNCWKEDTHPIDITTAGENITTHSTNTQERMMIKTSLFRDLFVASSPNQLFSDLESDNLGDQERMRENLSKLLSWGTQEKSLNGVGASSANVPMSTHLYEQFVRLYTMPWKRRIPPPPPLLIQNELFHAFQRKFPALRAEWFKKQQQQQQQQCKQTIKNESDLVESVFEKVAKADVDPFAAFSDRLARLYNAQSLLRKKNRQKIKLPLQRKPLTRPKKKKTGVLFPSQASQSEFVPTESGIRESNPQRLYDSVLGSQSVSSRVSPSTSFSEEDKHTIPPPSRAPEEKNPNDSKLHPSPIRPIPQQSLPPLKQPKTTKIKELQQQSSSFLTSEDEDIELDLSPTHSYRKGVDNNPHDGVKRNDPAGTDAKMVNSDAISSLPHPLPPSFTPSLSSNYDISSQQRHSPEEKGGELVGGENAPNEGGKPPEGKANRKEAAPPISNDAGRLRSENEIKKSRDKKGSEPPRDRTQSRDKLVESPKTRIGKDGKVKKKSFFKSLFMCK